jgi:hypothetical protein
LAALEEATDPTMAELHVRAEERRKWTSCARLTVDFAIARLFY